MIKTRLKIHYFKDCNSSVIKIFDEPTDLIFGFDDLVKFHGTKSICGLTASFKVMEAAWQEIWSASPPRREDLSVASAFPGPGSKDGFEMVTRAVSRDTCRVIPDAKPRPLVSEAPKGAYYFQLSDGNHIIELGLKPGMLPGLTLGPPLLLKFRKSVDPQGIDEF